MESNKYDISLIRKYLNGELDAQAMYQLERQAQEDPLLMDLILGMESGEQKEHDQALIAIDELIDNRIGSRKKRIVPLFRWSVAASIVIISGLAALFYLTDKRPVENAYKQRENPRSLDQNNRLSRVPDKIKAPDKSEELAAVKIKPVEKRRKIIGRKTDAIPENQEIAIPDKHERADSGILNDVVITAYASQEKKSLVGSVAVIQSEELASREALQGRVAGVEIITKKKNGPVVVTGIVRDKLKKEPLAGVSVRVKGTNSGVTTDINGRFMITVPESGQTLEFAYIGFDVNSVKVNKSDSLVIAMNPSSAALSEVVVVGYGAKRNDSESSEEEFKETQPVKGWQEYNSYLRDKAVVDKRQKGLVILTFNVSSIGSLSDFKVIKSSNLQLNQKAIDLVKEGPQWRGMKGSDQRVRLRIKFREKVN